MRSDCKGEIEVRISLMTPPPFNTDLDGLLKVWRWEKHRSGEELLDLRRNDLA